MLGGGGDLNRKGLKKGGSVTSNPWEMGREGEGNNLRGTIFKVKKLLEFCEYVIII